jgi:excisionase family DNA binding protein
LANAVPEDSGRVPVDDWISISEASRILGVSPPTLRRWSDAERVPTRKTLGGHRRFSRQSIESLSSRSAAGAEPAPSTISVSLPESLDRRDLASQEWHRRVSAEPGVARMRGLGQRLLGLLLQHVHSRLNESRYLAEAKVIGAVYGREVAQAHVSLTDTVQAYVYFRRACARLTAPVNTGSTQIDLIEAVSLHERIDVFMDMVLLGVLRGYEGDFALPPTDASGMPQV